MLRGTVLGILLQILCARKIEMKNTAKKILAFWVGSLFHVCLSQAATIVVDNDGVCTLADAITSANNDATAGGCSTGSGEDTIILQKDVILGAALPQIASTITIEGNGYKIDGQMQPYSIGTPLKIIKTGNLTLNNVFVTKGGPVGDGGGIYNIEGTVTINRSTVTGNAPGGSGGGICNIDGTVTINSSTITGNGSRVSGGGVSNHRGVVTINNSTISDNVSKFGGGGIYNDSGTVIINNATVSKNRSSSWGYSDGGGICNDDGEVILRSSIVSGNTNIKRFIGPIGNEIYGSAIIADSHNVLGHSGESNAEAFSDFIPGSKDVTATSDGTKPTALAAILSPLADNGGTTQTYALPMCSPAIDLDATCSTSLSTDQRGYMSRPVGSGCDAGSFEFDSVRSDTDGDGTPDACEQVKMIPIYNLLLKR